MNKFSFLLNVSDIGIFAASAAAVVDNLWTGPPNLWGVGAALVCGATASDALRTAILVSVTGRLDARPPHSLGRGPTTPKL